MSGTDRTDYAEIEHIMRQKARGERNRVGDFWGDQWCAEAADAIAALVDKVAHIEQLQSVQEATAKAFHRQCDAAEAERDKLRAKLAETYVDENGIAWNRPSAWAYYAVCRALKVHKAALAEAVEVVRFLTGVVEGELEGRFDEAPAITRNARAFLDKHAPTTKGASNG